MSEPDSWMYSRIAELEARLELANSALWSAEQRIRELRIRILRESLSNTPTMTMCSVYKMISNNT